MGQMLEAVQTIHEKRIIHGDLKPANFLFVEGCIKLIDFGIARVSSSVNILHHMHLFATETCLFWLGARQQCLEVGLSHTLYATSHALFCSLLLFTGHPK